MTDLTEYLLTPAPVDITDEDAARTEWLAWRKMGIGASDVAALAGMSKWASPMSVWTDKMGLTHDEDSDVMEFGRRAEPMLAGYFEDRTGLFLVDRQARAVHPDHSHHRATLDGRVTESPEGDVLGVGELKTTGWDEWAEVPDNYQCQVQWQMHVDQRDHAWIGALHGKRFRVYEVPRDQRSIDVLVEMVDTFWTDHVLAERPPASDSHEATARALQLAYPDPVEGETVPLDDLTWAIDLRASAAAAMSDAKVNKARAENAIKAAIGDAELGTVAGEPVVSWKLQTRAGHEVKASTFRALRTIGGRK